VSFDVPPSLWQRIIWLNCLLKSSRVDVCMTIPLPVGLAPAARLRGLVSRWTNIEGASGEGSCCFGFPDSVSAEDRADCEFFEPEQCPAFEPFFS